MRGKTQKPNQTSTTSRTTKQYITKGRASAQGPHSSWLDQPVGQAHEQIFQDVRSTKGKQVRRRYELAVFQQLYNNSYSSTTAAGGLFSTMANSASANYSRLSENVIASCVDTATARIAKSKPRAFVLPNKGDYRLKRKCEKLTKFLDGAFHSSGVYANAEEVFRDSGIYGTGALLLREGDGEIISEPVKVDELIVDQVDGMYDRPREISIEHPVPRAELVERYPDERHAIDRARMSWRGEMAFMSAQDMVLTVERWRLPSIPGGKDGRHVLCINGATLLDEPWAKDYIPVYRFHWRTPTYGPFGSGIAHALEGKQWMINNMLRDVAESFRMFAQPRIWVDTLSGVSQHTLTNEVSVNKYSGSPPIMMAPPAMAPDFYQFLEWLIESCFKQEGLSQLSAQSEKPAGLNSGVAMRTYQDVETQRFAIVGQRWERWFMAIAEGILDMSADMFKRGTAISVKVPGRGFIETVDWSDVSLKRDQYDIQIWPTNILPETPEGKLQAVQEWVSSGFMPRDVAIGQMSMPILNDWVSDETAARDDVEMCVSSILEKGKFIAPTGIGNVDLAVTLSQSAYLRAQYNDVEPHKVRLLMRFMTAALDLQAKKNAPPMAPPGAPAPGVPGAAAVGQAPPPPPAPLAPQGAGAITMPAAA